MWSLHGPDKPLKHGKHEHCHESHQSHHEVQGGHHRYHYSEAFVTSLGRSSAGSTSLTWRNSLLHDHLKHTMCAWTKFFSSILMFVRCKIKYVNANGKGWMDGWMRTLVHGHKPSLEIVHRPLLPPRCREGTLRAELFQRKIPSTVANIQPEWTLQYWIQYSDCTICT